MKAKILLFALPDFGSIVLETLVNSLDCDVKLILPELASEPSHPYFRIVEKAQYYKTDIVFCTDLNKPELLKDIVNFEPHFLLAATYTKKIPNSILNVVPIGLNIHFSLLPLYRGYDPIFWAVRNGEQTSGFSIHALNNKFDKGDVFGTYRIPLDEKENSYTFYKKIIQQAPKRIVTIIKAFLKGKNLRARPQAEGKFIRAPRVQGKDLKVNWNTELEDLDRLVRAAFPTYGAIANFMGEKIQIWRGRPIKEETGQQPGNLVKYEGELGVTVKNGVYLIDQVSAFDNNSMKFSDYVRKMTTTPVFPQGRE